MESVKWTILLGLIAGLSAGPAAPTNVIPVYGSGSELIGSQLRGWKLLFKTQLVEFLKVTPEVADKFILDNGFDEFGSRWRGATVQSIIDSPIVVLLRNRPDEDGLTFFIANDGLNSAGDVANSGSISDALRSQENVPVVFFPPFLPPDDLVSDLQVNRFSSSKVFSFGEFSHIATDLSNIPWVLIESKSRIDYARKGEMQEIGSIQVQKDRISVVKDGKFVEGDDFRGEPGTDERQDGNRGPLNFLSQLVAYPMNLIQNGFKLLMGLFKNPDPADVVSHVITPRPSTTTTSTVAPPPAARSL